MYGTCKNVREDIIKHISSQHIRTFELQNAKFLEVNSPRAVHLVSGYRWCGSTGHWNTFRWYIWREGYPLYWKIQHVCMPLIVPLVSPTRNSAAMPDSLWAQVPGWTILWSRTDTLLALGEFQSTTISSQALPRTIQPVLLSPDILFHCHMSPSAGVLMRRTLHW